MKNNRTHSQTISSHQGAFACVSPDCGEEAGGEPHRHGEAHAKNLTRKTPPTDQPLVKGTTPTAVSRGTSTLLPNSHVVPVAARRPSAIKGATVNLWRERAINLSEGERIKRAHTHTHMAEAVTQASLWGGPLIPFHRPQPSLLTLCGLQHHTAPTEKSGVSGWQRYHGRRDDEKALGSCAAAAISDKCASVHAANLSHVINTFRRNGKGTF